MALLLFCLGGSLAVAQSLPVINYSSDQGLPQSVVLAATQDAAGYLWLATPHGVSRFDGLEFRNFGRQDGVPDLVVRSFYEDHQGTLWLLTDGGLARRQGTAFEALEVEPEGLLDAARCMIGDGHGGLLVGTFGQGVVRLHQQDMSWQVDEAWHPTSGLPHAKIRDAHSRQDGSLWFATDGGGVARFHETTEQAVDGQTFDRQAFGSDDGLTNLHARVLADDADGNLLVGTKGGLFRWQGNHFTPLWPDILATEVITALHLDRQDRLWVGTRDRGLCIGQDHSASAQDTSSEATLICLDGRRGLAAQSVTDILQDREGYLWVTSYGEGISRLGEDDFVNYSSQHGLPRGGIEAIWEVDGQMWLGSQGDGAVTLSDSGDGPAGTEQRWHTDNGLPHGKVLAITHSDSGDVWLGTLEGAARWDGGRWQVLNSLGGQPLGVVLDILTRGETLWLATTEGLHELQGDPFETPRHRHFDLAQGLPSRRVNRLVLDPSGDLWLGTNDGVARYREGTFEVLAATASTVRGDRAEAFVADLIPLDDNHLWLCTAAGLRLYLDGQRQVFEHAKLLSEDACKAMAQGRDGRLWVGTNHGIHVLDDQQLATWTVHDAMVSGEVQPSAAFVDSRDRVWFGTARGAVVFAPHAGQQQRLTPEIQLQTLQIDGQPWPLETGPLETGSLGEVPSPDIDTESTTDHLLFSTRHRRDLRFEVKAISLSHADQITYRFRLEPLDTTWRNQRDGRIAFASLAAGTYHLVAQAHHLGGWGEPLTIDFRIVPAWWATPWSRAILGLALFALAYYGYRLRLRIQQHRQAELERQVEERTAEVEREKGRVRRKNEQLEINHLIVQQINAELDFSNLLQSILEGICFVVAADRAFALVWDQEEGAYVQRASLGGEHSVDDAPPLTSQTLNDALLTRGRALSPSLFVSQVPIPLPEAYAPLPQSYVVMTIELDDKAAGYLVVGRRREEAELSSGAQKALEELEDHVTSAFVKGRMLDELRRLNAKKNEFLGIAAHDLRSPLGSVMSCAELLLKLLDEGRMEKVLWQKFLSNMRLTSEQMLTLVNDLLDVSSIETGRVELQLETTCMGDLLQERRALLENVADDKDIGFHLDLNTQKTPIPMDRLRISEVLDNLLTNALKYTPPGGSVWVSYQVTESELVTQVKDTGQGLAEKELPWVFTGRKLSARPTAGESSHGLGLVIVKKLVELHGGRIWLESQQGQGSTFSFALPRQTAAE